MKVPTYKSQVKLNQAGSGNFLTVQANPNVYAQSGKALADLGQNILNMTVKKFEIEAQTQINNASSMLDTELYAISEKWKKYPHPQTAEASFINDIDTAIDRYSSGKRNDINGIPLLTNNLARNSFTAKSQELRLKYIREFKKHSNEKLISHNKANLSLDIDAFANKVADTSLSEKERVKNFNSIFSTDTEKQDDGSLAFVGALSRSFTDGTLDAEEVVTRREAAFSSIVKGTMQNLMYTSSDPSSIAQGFAKETLTDPIMKKIFAKLSEDEKFDLTKSFTTMANSIEKQRNDERDGINKELNDKLNQKFNKIFNLNPTIPEEKKQIDVIIADLTAKFHMDSTKWKNYDQYLKRFEEEDDGTDKNNESDRATLSYLYQLDADDNLTLDAINNVDPKKLTVPDFKMFMKAALQEKDDANSAAKIKISSAFKYEQYKDDNSDLSSLAKGLYFSTYVALNEWREGDGKNATYSEVQEYAKELIKKNKEPLKELVRDQFNTFLSVIIADGFFDTYEFAFDENDPINSLSKFFRQRTAQQFNEDAFLKLRHIEFKPYITYFAEEM